MASLQWTAIILLPAAVAPAHELEATVQLAAPAVVLHATYGGSEAVPFAKVQVFAPASPAREFQTGVTDRRGYFSFIPDVPGPWRIVIDDETGHRSEVTATVPDPFTGASAQPDARVSRLERFMLGLALIAGATGVWYGYRARRGPATP